jgi:hypothetical protein
MTSSKIIWVGLVASALCACSSSDEDHHDLGDISVGTGSFHVEQEGNWAPGTSTKYAIKANAGTPKPDQVSCYFGEGASSFSSTPSVAIADYDSGDDDFDCVYPTPANPPGDGRLFVQVTTNGIVMGSSINVAK